MRIVFAAAEGPVLLPEPADLIWGTVGFALLVGLLWPRVAPALTRLLDARAASVRRDIAEADEELRNAVAEREGAERRLAALANERDQILEAARDSAERLQEQAAEDAKREAAAITARAEQEAAAEMGRIVAELRQSAVDAVVETAGRIVAVELDESQQRVLIDRYISDLRTLN